MPERPYGLIAEFPTPAATLEAAEKIRDAGFSRWDVFSPFPVHGMDQAMGLKNSAVGWFAFIGATAGFLLGNLMVWWMNARDYAIPVGGKPMFSPWFAFPSSYELAMLFGALGAVLGLLWLNRLPRLHHPLLKHRRFTSGATHDRFFVVIECADPKYSEKEIRKLLEAAGGRRLELVEE